MWSLVKKLVKFDGMERREGEAVCLRRERDERSRFCFFRERRGKNLFCSERKWVEK
jgi:hypothetical protein